MPDDVVVSGVAREELLTVTRQLVERQPLSRDYKLNALTVPSLFICTHGQRDRCCAKFGYAVFASAEAERVGRALPIQI